MSGADVRYWAADTLPASSPSMATIARGMMFEIQRKSVAEVDAMRLDRWTPEALAWAIEAMETCHAHVRGRD